MSKQSGVFICPSCQNVVQSDQPLEKGVTCSECLYEFGKPNGPSSVKSTLPAEVHDGPLKKKSIAISRDVTASRAPVASTGIGVEKKTIAAKTLDEAIQEAVGNRDEEMIMPDGSRRVRRRKKRPKKEKNKNLILFLVGWVSVILVVFALFKLADSDGEAGEEAVSAEALNEKTLKSEILRRFYPMVTQNFMGFLDYPKNDGREQFISNSADLSLSFARHYRVHLFPNPDSAMTVVSTNVIKLAEKDFGIETLWEDEDGNKLGATHLWDGESWKLDWENFAPTSSEPWAKFLPQLGSKEGTFRLLVRKRETADETKKFYLSFYRPPIFGEDPGAFRVTESPEVELTTASDLGQEFLALWSDYKAGVHPYDSILPQGLDPPNFLRLTVVLAWEENERDESVIVLKDIVGVSWFGEVIQAHYREQRDEEKSPRDDEKSQNIDQE